MFVFDANFLNVYSNFNKSLNYVASKTLSDTIIKMFPNWQFYQNVWKVQKRLLKV